MEKFLIDLIKDNFVFRLAFSATRIVFRLSVFVSAYAGKDDKRQPTDETDSAKR